MWMQGRHYPTKRKEKDEDRNYPEVTFDDRDVACSILGGVARQTQRREEEAGR